MTGSVGAAGTDPRRIAFRVTLVGAFLALAGFTLYGVARGQIDGPLLQGITLYASLAIAGWLILGARASNLIGWMLAITGVLAGFMAGAIGVVVLYSAGGPIDRALALGAFLLIWLLFSVQLPFALIILLFPDGRLPDPRWRPIALAGSAAGIAAAVILALGAPPGQLPPTVGITVAGDLAGPLYRTLAGTPLPAIADATGSVLLLGALAAVVARYRAGRGLLRQQIKWFVAGAIGSVCVGLLVTPFEPQPGIVGSVARTIDILAVPLPLLGAAAGALRYRLWDVDVVLTRAAAVGVVWLALSAILIAMTFATGVVIAGSDPRIVVALVLAFVASAALPRLRRRVETQLARGFGADARGYLVLRRLSDWDPRSRPSGLGSQVVETACAAVGSEWAAAWLSSDVGGTRALRPLAATGLGAPLSVVLDSAALDGVARLPGAVLWADLPTELSGELDALRPLAPAAVATLRAGAQPVGLLAIGQRRAEPIEGSDLEVLAALGREVGLLLQNSRLQAELEARLAELDRYAGEVRESRARIVAAQDHERRRIERDLHDGVQQQLVNLATRLRRASLRPPGEQAGLLTDLAGEAETAVFALRELGRGIYPTILTDLGLPAALRAAAARVPLDIRVEIEPSIADRRLGSDVEAALYLVAMEAMTNTQKHAPGSDVRVSLRFDEHERRVLLTVEDNGPGMIGGSLEHRGAGLQNMRDRVAAVGGALTIGSPPGGGTRIAARVPIATAEAGAQVLGSGGRPAGMDGSASRR